MTTHNLVVAAMPGDLLSTVKWAKTGSKFTGFLATFAVFGALGFRLVRLRLQDWLATIESGAVPVIGPVFQRVDRRAAVIGEIGAWLLLVEFGAIVGRNLAFSHGGGIAAVHLADPEDYAQLILAPGLAVAFWFAIKGRRGGWQAALILGGALALRHVVTGRWRALVNPLHGASAALWLGTLLVIVVAALPVIMREPVARASRGPLVAGLMARFSPLALFSAGFVGLSGLLTSWLHLKYLSALWITPYGRVLLIKLVFVGCIVALGALNWRRVLPALGTGEGAETLGRVSRWELAFTLVVLVVTAVLVSMPSPKPPL
jgi:putative copper export protein